MNLLLWRQHRNQVLFAAVALAVLAALLLPTGMHLAAAYQAARRSCAAAGDCADIGNALFRHDAFLFDIIGLTAGVPALFGLFWGAPLVAAEIEAGTQLLAWTQTVTRRHWLAVKVTWVLAAAAAWGAAMSALVTWWSGPANAVNAYRFNLGHFDTQGLVPVAYSVFGAALGITAGILTRRVLPAMAVTLAGFAAVRFAVDYLLRAHYLAPLTRTLPLGSSAPVATGSYWVLGSGVLDPHGRASDGLRLSWAAMPAGCRNLFGAGGPGPVTRCLGAHGWRTFTTFQPADRFWTFQGIETGLYLLLATAVVAAGFLLLGRRDA